MLKKYCFAFAIIIYTFLNTSSINAFTIHYDTFMSLIQQENQNLSPECYFCIYDILFPYINEIGTIIFNNRTREHVTKKTKSKIHDYDKFHPMHIAAVLTYKLIKKLHLETKDLVDECSLCNNHICKRNKKELACAHAFCSTCIICWFSLGNPQEQGIHASCPVCHVPISPSIKNQFIQNSFYRKFKKSNFIIERL